MNSGHGSQGKVREFNIAVWLGTLLLKSVDIKKAAGVDKIPPKLVKIASKVLSGPLSRAINNSLRKGKFPDGAKVAVITPVDQKTVDDKNRISNFRPVSVLNTFSKIYEITLKKQLVASMRTLISPYISAYREGYIFNS